MVRLIFNRTYAISVRPYAVPQGPRALRALLRKPYLTKRMRKT